jgi:hypothetical protein
VKEKDKRHPTPVVEDQFQEDEAERRARRIVCSWIGGTNDDLRRAIAAALREAGVH